MSEPRCTDCGGIHYGSVGCPYYRSEPCVACGKILEYGEPRKFDLFGRTYHPACTFLADPPIKRLTHTRSCPSLTPGNEEDCTCGLRWRIALQTEQTMHAAWRKRAEQAEKELLKRERIVKDITQDGKLILGSKRETTNWRKQNHTKVREQAVSDGN